MVAQLADTTYGELLYLDSIQTTLAERRLRHFVKQAWHVVEPSTAYLHNWHIDALADHLEATLTGEIRNLLIMMPPRAMKSLTISVFFPAWAWIQHPELRFLYASYAQSLSTGHSMATRRVIESDWYQARWSDRFTLSDDDNLKTRFSNDARGERISTSVGAAVTGMGGDLVIADDPHSVQQSESDTVRDGVLRWWDQAMSTRLNNPKTGARIVVMQRVHENDLAGHVQEDPAWMCLNLPMEYEPTTIVSPLGWSDPRTIDGQLLWPERMDERFVATQKRTLGSMAYAAQYQQRPTPAEGGMFKRHWWRYWQPRGSNMPPIDVRMPDGSTRHVFAEEQPAWWDRVAQSWDMSFKETKSGSFVVGLVGATSGPNGYLLDLFRDRTDFPGSIAAVEAMTAKWPDAYAKYVEEKANGAAVIATLKATIPGLIAVQPDGGKESRAHAVTPLVEAGNWFLPHPLLAPWVTAFVDELASFPSGTHDDQVDTFSQLARHVMGWHDDESDDVIAQMNRELA
ncbi:MAG: phage terminase large subunit [Thermomicrobiales bacterium]